MIELVNAIGGVRNLRIQLIARLVAVCGLLIVLTGSPAAGQSWDEHVNGGADAPPLGAGPGSGIPGQNTLGSGALTTITGWNSGSDDHDVDVYCIRITNRIQFQAQVTSFQTGPMSLFLFDSNAMGVTQNSGPAAVSYFPSIHIPPLPYAFVAGKYWMAIANAGNYPSSSPCGSNPGGLIWDASFPGPTFEYAPNGPGRYCPPNSWAVVGPIYNGNSGYTITLTGAEFCDPQPLCPLPEEETQVMCSAQQQQTHCQNGSPSDLCLPVKVQIVYAANAPPQYEVQRCDCVGAEQCRLSFDSGQLSCVGLPEAFCTLQSDDIDGDGIPDEFSCSEASTAPTVSGWGLLTLTLLLLAGIMIRFGRRRGRMVA